MIYVVAPYRRLAGLGPWHRSLEVYHRLAASADVTLVTNSQAVTGALNVKPEELYKGEFAGPEDAIIFDAGNLEILPTYVSRAVIISDRPTTAVPKAFMLQNPFNDAGVKFLILRPDILSLTWQGGGDYLLWGGAVDPLRLRNAAGSALSRLHVLVAESGLERSAPDLVPRQHHRRIGMDAEAWKTALVQCRAVIAKMGTLVWECAALGIPCYVFSATPYELRAAKYLDGRGHVKAWPQIGLPSSRALYEFVTTPFTPTRLKYTGDWWPLLQHVLFSKSAPRKERTDG